MTSQSSAQPSNPSTLDIFRRDIVSFLKVFGEGWEQLVNWIFAYTQTGGDRRTWFFAAISALTWVGLTLLQHPLRGGLSLSMAIEFVRSLFAADVIRHFLVLGLTLWLGLRLAAIYLDDIFELNDVSVSVRFIRQAAFSGHYQTIRIREGRVDPEQSKSPVLLIGGPGLVDVHLENAALFEKTDGTPNVVGPTEKKKVVLEGFERLRKVVDLRDQVLDLSVDGRTQDGIRVTAKDVRLVCSVYRGDNRWTLDQSYQQPYPYTEDSILNLVYKQGYGRLPIVEAMRSMIRRELGNFINQHTLGEFLANAEESARFVAREQITDLFFDFAHGFSERAKNRGVELRWIGVGTWEIPAQIIPERHLEAWKLTCQNRVRRNRQALAGLREESRLTTLMGLIDEITATFYNLLAEGLTRDQLMRRLTRLFFRKLTEASVAFQNQNLPVPGELKAVLDHLSNLGGYRLGT